MRILTSVRPSPRTNACTVENMSAVRVSNPTKVRRLILVAENQDLLAGLRQSLDPLQPEWELHATRAGTTALDRMYGEPFDAVVTDSRIVGMCCADFLTEIRRIHPRVVRIALVGGTDQESVVRLAVLTHRLLAKPLENGALLESIRRAHRLRELLGSPALTELVGKIGRIPTLSSLYNQIASEFAHPDFSLAEVGNLVEQEPGIAAKLIQVANSALLGLRRPAATPAQAVRILGADLTQTLVLAADLFSRYDPAALRPFSIDGLWEHSRKVADLAGRIANAEQAGDLIVREAALAGLFHDIGRLIIVSQLPGPYKEVLSLMKYDGVPAAQAEWRVLGASHAEIGAYLLGLWGLADGIVEAVAWHHDPCGCHGESFSALTAVHAAEALIHGDEGASADDEYLARFGGEAKMHAWAAIAAKPSESRF